MYPITNLQSHPQKMQKGNETYFKINTLDQLCSQGLVLMEGRKQKDTGNSVGRLFFSFPILNLRLQLLIY